MHTPRVETYERAGILITDLVQLRVEGTIDLLQEDQRLEQEEVHLVSVTAAPGAALEVVGQGRDTLVLKVRRT